MSKHLSIRSIFPLPVYLNAALDVEQRKHPHKTIVPAGIFYYRIQDPIVSEEKTQDAVERSILKELKQDGLVNGDDMVISHLEKELSGNSLLFPIGRNKDGSDIPEAAFADHDTTP